MAVKRVWLLNAPSAGIDNLDRAQFLIGYPFALQSANSKTGVISYLRHYLNDTITTDPIVPLSFTPPAPINNSVGGAWEVSKSSILPYLKRYLNN